MNKKIAFTGGGTGGHIFPGVAVADRLKALGYEEMFWIGSNKGMDREILKNNHIPFYGIPTGKLRRYFSLHNFFDLFRIFFGLISSIIILMKQKPAVLFSKGGYVSVPPVMAASFLKIPVITHECDFDPGMATKINARFAAKILTSFPETKKFFPAAQAGRVVHTGNPVRQAITMGNSDKGRAFLKCPADRKIILVMGGSQGAAKLNEAVLSILDELTESFFVVHQMGARGFKESSRENYLPAPFFKEELPDILAAADLAVCRAGSNTLWELAATETPSILVPLSAASSRGDQIRNAGLFKDKGAAVVCEEERLQEELLPMVSGLMNDKKQTDEMKNCLKELTNSGTIDKIAEIIIKTAGV